MIIEAAGITRNTLESYLSMGLPNTPMAGARLSVSSGNYITAQPFGIHYGVDFQHTGSVREVHNTAIEALLDAGHLVLLPPLGYSLTGDVFNVTVNELAAAVAVSLHADKLVFLVDKLPADDNGVVIRQASALRLQQLYSYRESITANAQPDSKSRDSGSKDNTLKDIIPYAIHACGNGVDRVHLLDSEDRNALLCELYSRDGSGTMITASRWEHIRPASINDVRGIIELIEPLQANGTLIKRSREKLEMDIEHFFISERDGMVVACAAMYPDEATDSVEIACLATHERYRGEGRADQILDHLESMAREQGHRSARVLSTRTGHWFVERGYLETDADQLPASRRASYNEARNSKVYVKTLC